MPIINQHLKKFMDDWNFHSLSTENDKSPTRLFYEGLQKFVNCDELRDHFIKQFHNQR